MPKASQITFNAGELTEFMDPRVDVAKYSKGCRILENMEVLPFGTAFGRPGTKHGGEAKFSDRKCRVIPFTFSPTINFDIEVGHQYFRFWNDETRVEDPGSPGNPLEVTSTYQESELFEMQFEQIQDVVYITHPNHPLRKLIRLANDDWSLVNVDWSDEFNYPPMADENRTTTTLTASATTGTGVTLTASANLFTSDMVGEFITLKHTRDDASVSLDVPETGTGTLNSDPIYVLGDWVFQTTGNGIFDTTLQESDSASGPWITKRGKYDVVGTSANRLVTGTEQSPKYFRSEVNYEPDSGSDGVVTIEVADASQTGLVKITGYTSATEVTVEVIEDLESTDATTEWALEKFGSTNGYPRAICTHRNRLVLGSTDLFLSQPGNFENFRTRNDADSGFIVPIRRSGSPLVQWMEDLRELRVGTSQAECVVIPDNSNENFSYSNYRVRWDSNYGSKHVRAEQINGTALFLQIQGQTLRFQQLTGIEDYYDSNTLTILADHILGQGVTQSAYQRQRYPTWHGVREDGEIASLVYDQTQNIQAWYRTKTDGEFESISVTPRPDEEDHVTYVVKRTVDGVTKRHIEFKARGQYRTLQNGDLANMWFVDDGVQRTGSGLTTITGLEHLEGVTVAILADGAPVGSKTVESGEITLDTPADNVILGRPYDMRLIPMFLESQGVMGQSKNITGAIIRLWRAGRAQVRVDGESQWSRLELPPEFLDTAPSLYTGDSEKIHLSTSWSRNTTIEVKGSSPLPFTVQAITMEFEIGRG
jgi:hypothetical protein